MGSIVMEAVEGLLGLGRGGGGGSSMQGKSCSGVETEGHASWEMAAIVEVWETRFKEQGKRV